MNIIRITTKVLCRNYTTVTPAKHNLFLEHLSSRSLIRVQGDESLPFLQGLITNDMTHLSRHARGIYTMFLNKAGRILFDSVVYKTTNENSFIVECDRTVVDKLVKHLKMFRVRRKIIIDEIDGEHKVWSAFQEDNLEIPINDRIDGDEVLVCHDPRIKSFGLRIITPSSFTVDDVSKSLRSINVTKTDGLEYRSKRFQLGICEGVEEMPPEKSFPLEFNCDYMHGVSFHKGCYLGQEFTARTHHTGVVRKRIMPVKFDGQDLDTSGDLHVKNEADKSVGIIRGVENNKGIGLIRVAEALSSKQLFVQNVTCKIDRPFWWPKEMPPPDKSKNEVE